MPHASVNGLDICYETDGPADGVPIVLIAGLGVQLVDWPPHIIEGLVDDGHYVIRFDNRDIGLSTIIEDGPSDGGAVFEALLAGEEPNLAYDLGDLADDVAGLLDVLGIDAAHVVGVSFGGMIAQMVAIRHPERVASLTSIMSNTGASDVGQPTPEALEAMLSVPPAPGRDHHVEHGVAMAKVWASPDHYDIDHLRMLFALSWDRVGGNQAESKGRQTCAIIAASNREPELAKLQMPTLVIHGSVDTLIQRSGGERTAAVVPGAELLIVDGMGHDLPVAFAATILKGIKKLVAATTLATTTS